jgi:hypothetical protein
MPFPTTSVLDNFNRTENPLSDGGKWSGPLFAGDQVPQADGANCVKVGTNRFPEAYRSDQTYGPDCEAYLTIVTVGTGTPFVQVAARTQQENSSLDGYILEIIAPATWSIYSTTNEVVTTLGATITQAISAGDKFGIQCIGSTVSAYYNGVAGWVNLGGRIDVTYLSAGHIGLLFGDNSTWALNDFGGGTAVPAPTVTSDIKNFPKFFMRQPLLQGRLR